jgi:hypothetical protein
MVHGSNKLKTAVVCDRDVFYPGMLQHGWRGFGSFGIGHGQRTDDPNFRYAGLLVYLTAPARAYHLFNNLEGSQSLRHSISTATRFDPHRPELRHSRSRRPSKPSTTAEHTRPPALGSILMAGAI